MTDAALQTDMLADWIEQNNRGREVRASLALLHAAAAVLARRLGDETAALRLYQLADRHALLAPQTWQWPGEGQ